MLKDNDAMAFLLKGNQILKKLQEEVKMKNLWKFKKM